jgi:hypothetical protein
LGWSLLGTSITAQSLGFSGGPLGQTISTAAEPDGRLFIANAHFDLLGQGVAKVQLSDALGNIVANLEAPFGVPEPAGLAWIGLVGLATRIRRTFPSQSPVAPSIL